MTNNAVGANAKRLTAVMLAVALAMAIGAGFLGQARSASAQTSSPQYISKGVFPSPQSAIPVGTQMDFLITVVNNSSNFYRQVTLTDSLPGGVGFVSANASQGSCYAMADAPTIRCELGDMPPGNVVHANFILTAETPGTYTNVVQDSLGNRATATYTIVPASSGGTTVAAGGASVRTCPGGVSVTAGGASVVAGSGC